MNTNRIRIIGIVGIVIVVIAVVAGVYLSRQTPSTGNHTAVLLQTFTQNQVQVDINLERDAQGQMFLAATYKPLQDGFHLYSKDLPRTGIDGVGRPTLLEIPKQASLQTAGAVADSVPAKSVKIEGMDQPFPIYPDGPVTLRLPVVLTDPTNRQAQVTLTYMACSLAGMCEPPVMNKTLSLQLPAQS